MTCGFPTWPGCTRRACANQEVEPPVPPNLASLSAGLDSFADFIKLDRDLLAAAATASRSRKPAAPSASRLRAWVRELPPAEKDELIVKLMRGQEPHLGAQLMRRFTGTPAQTPGRRRTVARLLKAAHDL